MQKIQSHRTPHTKTFDLILTSMLASLVFIATLLLNIKLPIAANGGLVHLGTAMLFMASILFGPKKGAIAGAIGMGMFDLVGGWVLWAPFTFITRGLQGYIVGKIAWSNGRRGTSFKYNLLAMLASVPFMIAGYYICERILFNSWIIPLASIPGDVLQCIVGIAIAIPVCAMLKKVPMFK
ncbi:ECF transporter S component [Sporosarcina sp. PTS2304]|uniref:ECF transporter S component n=1 Tax=Sporosarcina sp. PTS2304 TaxID=2283194 RepID=UPI000E0DBEC2|nr:ECF transporter S component [Sporosarcina sp. PTS2304]AXI00623.1 ECF transporter S component [Sporosarcina sp. PTS2304]